MLLKFMLRCTPASIRISQPLILQKSVGKSALPLIRLNLLERPAAAATTIATTQFSRSLHLTSCCNDLMEFFDDKKNWGEKEVKVGRSWRVDELRIRSNTDLHKLWYILLKERNMLMTMEHECKRLVELFPNPERLDKVEESLENIETVVKERNRAYYFLETGISGERPGEEIENFLGLQEYVQHNEYHIPKHENKEYLKAKRDEPKSSDQEKQYFMVRLRAKRRKEARQELKRQQFYVLNTLRNFPHCDIEALKEKYPLVDVNKYMKRIQARHCDNLVGMKSAELKSFPWRL